MYIHAVLFLVTDLLQFYFLLQNFNNVEFGYK